VKGIGPFRHGRKAGGKYISLPRSKKTAVRKKIAIRKVQAFKGITPKEILGEAEFQKREKREKGCPGTRKGENPVEPDCVRNNCSRPPIFVPGKRRV